MIMTLCLTKIIRYIFNVLLIISSCNFTTENESIISWVTNAPSPYLIRKTLLVPIEMSGAVGAPLGVFQDRAWWPGPIRPPQPGAGQPGGHRGSFSPGHQAPPWARWWAGTWARWSSWHAIADPTLPLRWTGRNVRPSYGSWKHIPCRSFLLRSWSEGVPCLPPWQLHASAVAFCVLLSVGSDPSTSMGQSQGCGSFELLALTQS